MSGEALDTELMDAKVIKKLRSDIGDGAIKEFLVQTDEQLKQVISSCTMEMEQADRETKKNDAFAKAQGIVDDFKAALRGKKNPLARKVAAAAFILGQRKEAAKG